MPSHHEGVHQGVLGAGVWSPNRRSCSDTLVGSDLLHEASVSVPSDLWCIPEGDLDSELGTNDLNNNIHPDLKVRDSELSHRSHRVLS
ncbi:Hypothetical predicted protein [Xyrichtys novacula]|uniref:Uncharacterized protein n=1 Tax=Xyrichtys novacula TaxID=13765 RepID=A0AAV1G7Q5_XYRNO|nr:Hypothetical predicted protein [Xyrichtys novacula]